MNIIGERLRLYAVTDRAWAADQDSLFRQIEEAIDGGASIVQLREKHLDEAVFLAEAEQFTALCRRKGVVSIINDRVDIALKSGADGVHVGQADLEAGSARDLLGPDKILGVSAHSVEEALRAQAAGADYLGVGAMVGTATKPEAGVLTPDEFRAIAAAVDIPIVAIGGVNAETMPRLADLDVDGAAVVSAIFAADDIEAATAELSRIMDDVLKV